MKSQVYLILICLLGFVENGIAQPAIGGRGFSPTNNSFQEASGMSATLVNITTREKIKTLGSEYMDDSFKEATVNKGTRLFDLRYNNYSGFFEYKKNEEEIVILSKESNHEIRFKDGKTYLLKKYRSNKVEKTDYLLIVGKNDSKIRMYKLENIEFIPYKEAFNNYQEEKLPEYKKKKPIYFIEYQDRILPVEKSKDLERVFPTHAKEIKKFVHQRNIDFNSDDMILVQNFLISIL